MLVLSNEHVPLQKFVYRLEEVLVKNTPGIFVRSELRPAVIVVLLFLVFVRPENFFWWVWLVMGHLDHLVRWDILRMLDHSFRVVSAISKASNITPDEEAALKNIKTYGLRCTPCFAKPDPH